MLETASLHGVPPAVGLPASQDHPTLPGSLGFLPHVSGLILPSMLGGGGFPGGSDSKESACNAGDPGSIPGLGRSPGEGNGDPFQSFLPGKSHRQKSLMGYSLHGVAKSWTPLSN